MHAYSSLFAALIVLFPVARSLAEDPAAAVDGTNGTAASVDATSAGIIAAGRRPAGDDPVVLGLKDVPIVDTIRFIVESTGKAVIVTLTDIQSIRITLIEDKPI